MDFLVENCVSDILTFIVSHDEIISGRWQIV